MRARVYDKLHNLYYISEVYGILNRAGDWYIVDHPSDKQQVILVEYLNLNTPAPIETALKKFEKVLEEAEQIVNRL